MPGLRKLTLSVSERAVACGKRYAESNGTSLSSLVDSFLSSLERSAEPSEHISAVEALMGIAKGPYGERDCRHHLEGKYA